MSIATTHIETTKPRLSGHLLNRTMFIGSDKCRYKDISVYMVLSYSGQMKIDLTLHVFIMGVIFRAGYTQYFSTCFLCKLCE